MKCGRLAIGGNENETRRALQPPHDTYVRHAVAPSPAPEVGKSEGCEVLLGCMGGQQPVDRLQADGPDTAGDDDASLRRLLPYVAAGPARRCVSIHASVRSRPSSRFTVGS